MLHSNYDDKHILFYIRQVLKMTVGEFKAKVEAGVIKELPYGIHAIDSWIYKDRKVLEEAIQPLIKALKVPKDERKQFRNTIARVNSIIDMRKKSVFIGRQKELKERKVRWKEMKPGKPGLLIVEGPAGCGKTAFIERLLTNILLDEDVDIDRIRCSYTADKGPSHLVNWLGASFDFSGGREKLYERIDRMLSAKQRGYVVFIDDLQWVDSDTLNWLNHFFLNQSPLIDDTRVMIIGSVRTQNQLDSIDAIGGLDDIRKPLSDSYSGPQCQDHRSIKIRTRYSHACDHCVLLDG